MIAFANAPAAEQREALSEIRAVASSNLSAITTLLFGLGTLCLGLTFGAWSSFAQNGQPAPQLLMIYYGVLALVAVTSAAGFVVVVAKSTATYWLREFEAELALRYSATGREAKRWRSARPIQWH